MGEASVAEPSYRTEDVLNRWEAETRGCAEALSLSEFFLYDIVKPDAVRLGSESDFQRGAPGSHPLVRELKGSKMETIAPRITFERLNYKPPLDFARMLDFLKARAIPGVEAVDESSYKRTVVVNRSPETVEIRRDTTHPALLMTVHGGRGKLSGLVKRARHFFDLDADPARIARRLRRSERLASLVSAAPGLRVPGAWDAFELAVRAVLGQQVSVRGATTLAGRLVQHYGQHIDTGVPGLSHAFPTADVLAEADLSGIGIPQARAATIRFLASAVARREVVLDSSAGLDDAVDGLCRIPGVGPWTAHYIAMRGLGHRDAFPASDLGVRRALSNGAVLISPAEAGRLAEEWRPWRAYAVMYLWTAPQ